jgi:hypothetical protein
MMGRQPSRGVDAGRLLCTAGACGDEGIFVLNENAQRFEDRPGGLALYVLLC